MALNFEQLLFNLLLAVIFSVLGFVLLFLGYRLFDALTPMDLGHKIFDEGNIRPPSWPGRSCWGWP